MSATSEMLAELVPQLAPTADQVADDQLVGMWAYRNEDVERLTWRGRDEDCEQLESAVETALWLFEDRRSQGDTATIEVADGILVIEHGTRGVIAAWYAANPKLQSGTTANPDQTAASNREPPDDEAFGTRASRQTRSTDEPASTGSLQIDTRPDQTAPSEASTSGTQAHESHSEPYRAPRQSGANAEATESTSQPRPAAPAASNGNNRLDARSRSGRDPQGDRNAASNREAARAGGPDTSGGPDTGRQLGDQGASPADSEPLNFEIAFVDHDDSASGGGTAPISTGPVCDWADVIDHLEALTEMVNDHLGDTVTMNYWREALENHDSLEEHIEVELYGGLEAGDRSAPLDSNQAAELHEARSEWVRRCRRTISSTASGFHNAPAPPWSDLLDSP